MLEPLYWVVRRDLTIAMRRRSDVFTTLIFFVIVVSLFPLGIGPEPNTLRLIAPGIVWVGALLASMLALEQIFSADHRDGTLEQMLLTPQPVALLVAGKVLAHWLVSGVPLVLMSLPLYDMVIVIVVRIRLRRKYWTPTRYPSPLVISVTAIRMLPATSPTSVRPIRIATRLVHM